MRRLKRLLAHVLVALGFGGLAAAWSFPLVLHLGTHLPGASIGDNAAFVWNFWWMRSALASGAGFFHTPYLFAPVGADLTLHTHSALQAFVGATLLRGLSPVAALNVTTLASIALDGFCAYLLAWRIVRHRAAAVLAGVIFGTSPYVAAHLGGHFNLVAAWPIPLFALVATDAARGSVRSSILAGVVLALTAYTDYYYVVYEVALWGIVLVLEARRWRVEAGGRPPLARWVVVLAGAAIAADLALIAAICLTGGFVLTIGPVRVSAYGAFNPLQALWLLGAVALWAWVRPHVTAQRREGWSSPRALAGVGATFAVFLVLALPLVLNAVHLVARGAYVTQRYHWLDSPVGADLATLVLGNPFHGAWGGSLRHVYSALGVDAVESGAWLGLVPALLAAWVVRRKPADAAVRLWASAGAVFFLWALGSHVHAGGFNTGMIVPGALLRYVPFAANARMPGRAMVVVYLALAVLSAVGVARLGWRRPAVASACLAALVLADFAAAPVPLVPVACPEIYRVVRDRPERGALVELPLSVGDGLGDVTPVDRGVMIRQSIHGRPLVGGVMARLPASILDAYRADPLLAGWLRLSGSRPGTVQDGRLPDRALARLRMEANGIAFVMLDRRRASPQLREHVERDLPLEPIAEDDERTLYRLAPDDWAPPPPAEGAAAEKGASRPAGAKN